MSLDMSWPNGIQEESAKCLYDGRGMCFSWSSRQAVRALPGDGGWVFFKFDIHDIDIQRQKLTIVS